MTEGIITQHLNEINDIVTSGYIPDAREVMQVKACLPWILDFCLKYDGTKNYENDPDMLEYYRDNNIRPWAAVVDGIDACEHADIMSLLANVEHVMYQRLDATLQERQELKQILYILWKQA